MFFTKKLQPKKLKSYNLQASEGFTMVELLVAMGLFVVVISIASGAFIRGLRSQQAIISLMAINDNASLTLEQMAREIRIGKDFRSVQGDELRFVNAAQDEVSYRFNQVEATVERAVGDSVTTITGSSVKVRRLAFMLSGAEPDDNHQPRVTIILSVGADRRDIRDVTTDVQTTVSPRVLERE